MASSRDPTRLRQGLLPLATGLAPSSYHAQLNTPMSAVSMASSHLTSTAQTPSSSIQPYNPQEWMPSPAAVGGQDRGYAPRAPESQASAPPPPPYSPPRSQQPRPMSLAIDHVSTPSPRVPSAGLHRPSPEPQQSTPTSFPPPPGPGRGGSRERRFGLPSFSRPRETDQQTSSSQDRQVNMARARQSIGPMSIISPEPQHVASPAMSIVYGPPAARRAASTGAIDTPISARSRSSSQSQWEPGMPLPPPPPGPPPPGSRSQSVQPVDRNAVPIISAPTRRPPQSSISTLGPVPPTPADWVDDSGAQASRSTQSPALSPDASSPDEAGPSSAGLNRTRAVRHDKTILQRRTESWGRHGAHGPIDERSHPNVISNIVVPDSASENNTPSKPSHGRTTPQSGNRYAELPHTGGSISLQDSRNSTPRALGSARLRVETSTPPFSPHPSKAASQATASQVAPKSLPTPPPHTISASSSRPRETSRPPTTVSTPTTKYLVVSQSAEQFAAGTIERFQAFAAKESESATDADRVRLFADFVVNESRIRRERYATAIGAMGSEIFDLTRDLFRPMTTTRRESTTSYEDWTPQSSEPPRSQRESVGSVTGAPGPSSSAVQDSPSGGSPANATWAGTNYMPSLSPILSMSVSENYENGSSRGRPPSRWWESSSQGDPERGMERTKRESKYMGVSKDQWTGPSNGGSGAAIGTQPTISEYPPEKVGWHESSDASQSTEVSRGWGSSPAPHDPELMDISRLVTMPPPYPRHHPAVNNSHPELASIRTAVRALSDLAQVEEVKGRFTTASSQRRLEYTKATADRQRALRTNLQTEISSGNLGYADAAAIESSSKEDENAKKKEMEKTEYELFQNEVVVPLNNLLMRRIGQATELLDDLASRLFTNGQNDADMPQEEGDDRPELLEKLTLLKWIFEAREGLHRVNFDILSDRNTRYREVVITPYRLANNIEKLKSAEAFFAEDVSKREYAYANEALDRSRAFRAVMEQAVDHGVALQLSAFWDIAPPLHRLLDNIPTDLDGFGVQIPASEMDENPAYISHPLQYLFTLLLHAEKSTYQFIEANTNLLCLSHEVKEAVAHAKAKVLGTQAEDPATGAPLSVADREERARNMRWAEERRLTEDLKERVRTVQDQWRSALGEVFKGVKERTGEMLLRTGGWDETFEDAGVGSV